VLEPGLERERVQGPVLGLGPAQVRGQGLGQVLELVRHNH